MTKRMEITTWNAESAIFEWSTVDRIYTFPKDFPIELIVEYRTKTYCDIFHRTCINLSAIKNIEFFEDWDEEKET